MKSVVEMNSMFWRPRSNSGRDSNYLMWPPNIRGQDEFWDKYGDETQILEIKSQNLNKKDELGQKTKFVM